MTLIILAISIAIRVLYIGHAPGVILSHDSYSYYSSGNRIFETGIPGDDARTPVYPFLMAGMARLFGGGHQPELFSAPFLKGMHLLIFLQSLSGLMVVIFLNRLAKKLHISSIPRYLLLLIAGTNIMLFANERMILAEACATAWLVGITLYLYSPPEKPGWLWFFALALLYMVGVFLKPVYMFFPLATIPIVCWLHLNKRFLIGSAAVLTVFFISIVCYIRMNAMWYGYPGISHTGDINLLGKILLFNLPVDAAKQTMPELSLAIESYRQSGREPQPYYFLEYYDREIYGEHKEKLNELSRFNRMVVLSSFPQYAMQSFGQIPMALTQTNQVVLLMDSGHGALAQFFQLLHRFYASLQWLLLLFPIAIPIALWTGKKERTDMLLPVAVGCYQVVMSVFFSYEDYGRLISPALPVLYLVVVWVFTSMIAATRTVSIGAFPSRWLRKKYHSRE